MGQKCVNAFSQTLFVYTKRVALVMIGVASQHSQPHSLKNTSKISGPASIVSDTSGSGSTSASNQQALQHSPHHDSQNDTNLTSDSPPPPGLELLMTTARVKEALAPKELPPRDEVGAGQEPVVIKEKGEGLNGLLKLSEQTPELSVGSGNAEMMVNDSDAQDWIPDADHELKRVKVCHLLIPVIYQSYYDNAMFSVFNGKIA